LKPSTPSTSDIYIPELPSNADTDHLIRGSNLLKFQANLGPRNSLSAALPRQRLPLAYEGISRSRPSKSTDNHDILAWLPWVRDQQSFRNGVMLDAGFGVCVNREGLGAARHRALRRDPRIAQRKQLEPKRLAPSASRDTPTSISPRDAGREVISSRPASMPTTSASTSTKPSPPSLPARRQNLLRQSVFPAFVPFTRNNLELGAWIEDRWTPIPACSSNQASATTGTKSSAAPALSAHRPQLVAARR